MQISKIAVSNQFSANQNQKSPAFGDRLIFLDLVGKRPRAVAESFVGSLQHEHPGIQLSMGEGKVGDTASAYIECSGHFADKLRSLYDAFTAETRKIFGISYEGNAKTSEQVIADNKPTGSVNLGFSAPVAPVSRETLRSIYGWTLEANA